MMETTTGSDCRDGPWTRPWLATAEFWEQCRERKEQFDIDPATEFEAREVDRTKTSEEQEASRFRFMELPAEIRMQIYYWLHLMSPVRHAQLAPWYPIPVYSHYIVSPITPESQPTDEEELTSKEVDSHVEQEMIKDMLSPFRPLSALPSNLLRANSKIYFESRIIPFKNNEFVFVNWFASGLWAAKAFTENLQLWQCAHLRFIRLEMLYRDFTSPGYEAWVKLCTSWASSVKGLRLKILITGGHLVHEAKKKQIKNGEQFMVKLRRDISIGVEKMKKLKRLELELSTEEFEDWRKIELCRVLEEELRSSGMDVTVVSTKKVRWWTRRTGTDEPLPVG